MIQNEWQPIESAPTILFREHGGVVPNNVPFIVHDPETCTENEPHEVFYMQLSDDGQHIRKWSRSPFEGARKCRVSLPPPPESK